MDEENSVVSTPPVDSEPVAAPAADTPPVQVISVDELIERLTPTDEETEEPPADGAEAEPSISDQFFSSALEDTTGAETVQLLKEIKAEIIKADLEPHDLMTTRFSDYTVTEGLLLLALLGGVASVCWKMLRRGFSWLNW